MQDAYLLIFCKIVVGLLFAISFLFKLKNFPQYVNTVSSFRLLPRSFSQSAAYLVLACELAVIIFLYKWQLAAFWLATGLLVIFSAALASVLLRNIKTVCNCFGANQNPVSPADLIRNLGFILCSWGGGLLAAKPGVIVATTPLEVEIIGFAAIAFVLVWTQLGEVYHLLQPN